MLPGVSRAATCASTRGAMSGTKRALHRKSIGRDTSLNLFPGNAGGDRETLSHARRIDADGGGATAVAEIVEEDMAAPVCLCGKDIEFGFGRSEGAHESPRQG